MQTSWMSHLPLGEHLVGQDLLKGTFHAPFYTEYRGECRGECRSCSGPQPRSLLFTQVTQSEMKAVTLDISGVVMRLKSYFNLDQGRAILALTSGPGCGHSRSSSQRLFSVCSEGW